MNLQEAIDLLKNNNYLVESEHFSKFDSNRLSKNYNLTKKSAEKRNVNYTNKNFYGDDDGRKWIYVKKHDDITLKAAILDGLMDAEIYKSKLPDKYKINWKPFFTNSYDSIESEEQINEYLEPFKDLVNQILNFLHKYMHGQTTVYRGLYIDRNQYRELSQNMKFRHQLIDFFDNTSKDYNSFTVDYNIAKHYAGENKSSIVIAGEAEPNDILFAFTAYLMAKHHSIEEYELNINNVKKLKNLRLANNEDIYKKYSNHFPKLKARN